MSRQNSISEEVSCITNSPHDNLVERLNNIVEMAKHTDLEQLDKNSVSSISLNKYYTAQNIDTHIDLPAPKDK